MLYSFLAFLPFGSRSGDKLFERGIDRAEGPINFTLPFYRNIEGKFYVSEFHLIAVIFIKTLNFCLGIYKWVNIIPRWFQ